MHPLLNIAIQAARRAGDMIYKAAARPDKIKVFEKGRNNYVTNVDQQAEKLIIETIHRSYPEHAILAEETGLSVDALEVPEHLWVIDPLDGTNNFMHGLPHYAVSVAYQHQGIVQHGVIYDPIRQELFSASRGSGAQMNGQRLRVSPEIRIDRALVGTGFSMRGDHPNTGLFLNYFQRCYQVVSGMRRAGSAALDLAYVAAGRLEGYWEMELASWDLAAGSLLVKEAGGYVTDFNGEDNYLKKGEIIAASPKIHTHLLDMFLQG